MGGPPEDSAWSGHAGQGEDDQQGNQGPDYSFHYYSVLDQGDNSIRIEEVNLWKNVRKRVNIFLLPKMFYPYKKVYLQLWWYPAFFPESRM